MNAIKKVYFPVMPFNREMTLNVVADGKIIGKETIMIKESLLENSLKQNNFKIPVYTAHKENNLKREVIGTITNFYIGIEKASGLKEIIAEVELDDKAISKILPSRNFIESELAASIEIKGDSITGIAVNNKKSLNPLYPKAIGHSLQDLQRNFSKVMSFNEYKEVNKVDYWNLYAVAGDIFSAGGTMEKQLITFEDVKEFIHKYNIDPVQIYGDDLLNLEISDSGISLKSKYKTLEYSLKEKFDKVNNTFGDYKRLVQEKDNSLKEIKTKLREYKIPEIKNTIYKKLSEINNEKVKVVLENEKEIVDFMLNNIVQSKYDIDKEESINDILKETTNALQILLKKYENSNNSNGDSGSPQNGTKNQNFF